MLKAGILFRVPIEELDPEPRVVDEEDPGCRRSCQVPLDGSVRSSADRCRDIAAPRKGTVHPDQYRSGPGVFVPGHR